MGPDRIPADWPLRDYSEFVHCGEIVWHTQRIGAGPVVLLLHGTGASTHSMAGLATLLSRQFTCLLIDLPGAGIHACAARTQTFTQCHVLSGR
jgi:magnesium chelatase accessory protein